MSSGEESLIDAVRRHHRQQVNDVLRRPGMYGRDETAERLLLEAMAAVAGLLTRWRAECDGLRDRRAVTATGVRGAYSAVLPAGALRDATASMYAGIAHRCGWLDLDRALPKADHRRLAAGIGDWVIEDRSLSEVVETYGTPSLWIGGRNPFFPKTLCYITADPADELICLHLWNTFAGTAPEPRGVHPEPVLLAVRHRPGDFPGSFSFTPQGRRLRPTADQQSTAWVFHGDRARFASAVFETMQAGLSWAAEHQVTGVLAEYPYGGAYGSAIAEGRFTPSKPRHGTAEHVFSFSPGLRHVHLTGGRPD